METDGDGQYQELQEELLAEVSSSFPHSGTAVNPHVTTPMSIPVQPAVSVLSGPSTSSLPESADQRMKTRLDNLRQPAITGKPEKEQKDTQFNFDTPASSPPWYPCLDGHPRRITPIPISIASFVAPVQAVKSAEQLRQENESLVQRLEREKRE